MARTLKQALAERAQLAEQVCAMNAQLTALDDEIFSRVQKISDALESGIELPPTPPTHSEQARILAPAAAAAPRHQYLPSLLDTSRKTASRNEITAATTEVLQSKGHPVKLQALLEELTKRGVVVGGARPSGNLSAHLGLAGKFETARDGWWFKGQPRP